MFLNKCIEKISIIYYVLSHSIFWRNRFSLKTWLRAQLALTEKISIIYYVLSHSISWRARFSLKTRLQTQFALTEETSTIYYVLSHSISRWTHWENLYHLLCAFSSCFSMSALSLKKSLLFNECFLIESSYWENLYYLLCAFSFYSSTNVLRTSLLFTMCFLIESSFSTSALSLRNSLLFCMCFLIVFFNERIVIEKISTI